ncbi:c-type cytochrome [Neptunomonas japonica]|uniref:Cytochrome c, class II n=1 Tax=Neptunomonas japonica JAMM 1380 TaxID=1441457 RepID=A0A7R6SXN9_9GAMM|nr:cytochrome c [Neptunomonas japonica]BBB31020.1 cytochrome c, class II [Neptunomonas japonica JAMM 1380]
MKKIYAIGLAAAVLMGSNLAVADKVEDAIEYRQGVFKTIKWNFGPMVGMVKGKIDFDAADFSRRADLVAVLAKMPGEGFIEGSDMGDTDAKSEIWENKAEFDKGMDALAENAAALAVAAQSGDMSVIKPAFGQLGKTCKGCHDDFREKE